MTHLASAARELLESLDTEGSGEVRRVTLEVTAEGRAELVTVTLQPDGSLLVASTDGKQSGPHIRAALELLSGAYSPPTVQARPSIPPQAASTTSARTELANATEDLLVAIVRHGVDEAYGTASVNSAIDGVLAALAKPTPMGIARFIGRIYTELASHDVHAVARVLDGATRFVAHLRAEEPLPEDDRKRIAAWIGRDDDFDPARETLHEKTLVEIGREWMAGTERGSIQRRYLMLTSTGEIFCEERHRTQSCSVGPCPRVVTVGLAEIKPGPVPRRIRPLQYAVSVAGEAEDWERVAHNAVRSVEDLAPRYRADVKAYPALAEPVAVVSVDEVHVARSRILTPAGDVLPLRLAPGVGERIDAIKADHPIVWMAGRLRDDAEGRIALDPFSAGLEVDEGIGFERLR